MRLTEHDLEVLDARRGDVPRSAYIRALIHQGTPVVISKQRVTREAPDHTLMKQQVDCMHLRKIGKIGNRRCADCDQPL